MKAPEEIVNNTGWDVFDNQLRRIAYSESRVLSMIKQAQIEAWNEAIEAAAKSAKSVKRALVDSHTGFEYYGRVPINKKSILKLKK